MWNKRKKKRRISVRERQKKFRRMIMLGGLMICLAFFIVYFLHAIYGRKVQNQGNELDIMVDLLTINDYSRPGTLRNKTKGIVIHYVANPKTTAKQNRDYFESLKDTHITKASSHFIVGLDGEIVQCIPTKEIAYASNNRNEDTISIEVCHPDETGQFNKKSYNSVIKLTAWLANKYQIRNKNIIRHYDVTGKLCPKYYVEHQDAWEKLKKEIKEAR